MIDGVYKLNDFNRARFSHGIWNVIDNVELHMNSIREM